MCETSNASFAGTNKVCAQEDPQRLLKVLLVAEFTIARHHTDLNTTTHLRLPMIARADLEPQGTKVTRRMTRSKMKELPLFPHLLGRNSPGRALDMEGTGERANLADIIHSDDRLANPLREVEKGLYSTSRIPHFPRRMKSIMLIIHHRYQVALGSALRIGI